MKLHVGLDDTDSPKAGCTTYVAALLAAMFHKMGTRFIDYPSLIRLNPNVPWKTRGNGALCLRIQCEENLADEIKECAVETIEENSDLSYQGTDPGVVFLTGEVPREVELFAQKTIQGLVKIDEALRLIKKHGAEAVGFKKGRGIIGGLAATGEMLKGDHTYEFIAYRSPENRGTRRRVDVSSIVEMDRQMGRLVFNNVDPETGRVLITPRGPDPILYGIRGETAAAVKRAHEFVRADEPIERWVVFRTNHGTDAHLKRAVSVSEVKPHNPVIIRAEVTGEPRNIQGGHVIFQIQDETGAVDCAAYKPTGVLRDVAKLLKNGDLVEAYGGVRPPSPENPLTVNLEKMRIIELKPNIVSQNPLCPNCGKRMKSMGRGQGFECEKCGFHGRNLKKIASEVERSFKTGLYVTSPRSQRHLTKPLVRYGLEKADAPRLFDKIVPIAEFYGS